MNKLISSNNTLSIQKEYQYELTSTTIKIANNNSNQKIVIFYTKDDDELHYVEDACEELCNKHNLPFTTTKFYEYDTINEKWFHIDIKWDNKRFRGCSFVELNYNPLHGKPKLPKIKKNDIVEINEKEQEAKEVIFNTYQQLLQAK